MSASVASRNPFALLDAEGASPPPAPAKQTSPDPAPAPAQSPRGTQRGRGGPASRGGKYYARGGSKGASKETGPLNQDGIEEPPSEGRRFEGRGRGRGRGGRGGGRGRPFDKHSQTGKVDSEKKVHQSWGGDDGNTELKAEQAAVTDAVVDASNDWTGEAAPAADWGDLTPAAPAGDAATTPAAETPAGEDRGSRPRREREPEEDDNTLTLDQYRAQQKELEDIPKLEGRKANEGADELWKDVVPLQKDETENSYFVGKGKSAPKARAKKEEKVFIEIDGRFERPARGGGRGRGGDRGGRGDRGGDRGRGRGGPRGGRANGSSGPAPRVDFDDQSAFPSLG